MVITIDIILKFCTALAAVGLAITYMYKTYRFVKKPADEVMQKINKHDDFLANDKARLDNLEHMMVDIRRFIVLLLESEMAILEHLEDGNHTQVLKEKKQNIADYLYGHIGGER